MFVLYSDKDYLFLNFFPKKNDFGKFTSLKKLSPLNHQFRYFSYVGIDCSNKQNLVI